MARRVDEIMIPAETSDLYYEAHVTIEPVFDDRLELFAAICKRHHFRVAELLLKKRSQDTEVRSSKDSFCAGRSKHFSVIANNTQAVVKDLIDAGFDVWRYKIEDTILDSKVDDIYNILKHD